MTRNLYLETKRQILEGSEVRQGDVGHMPQDKALQDEYLLCWQDSAIADSLAIWRCGQWHKSFRFNVFL